MASIRLERMLLMVLRLDKILSDMGWGTRKETRKLIKKGLVSVNSIIIRDPAYKVNPDESNIQVGEEKVVYQKYIYVMLNKPAGYLSATEDETAMTVLDLLSPQDRAFHPFPVGRLDKDTEGLLIITNDGKLGHILTTPKKKVPKTYYAVVKGRVTEEDREAFALGVVLEDGYKTKPGELTIVKEGETSEIKLVIYEGKYHQVKRMFRAVGKEVLYLKRLGMGELFLDESLELGQYRQLREKELELLCAR